MASWLIGNYAIAAPVISPSTAAVIVGNTIQFSSTDTVSWSMAPGSTGTISAGGLYTAPRSFQAKNVVLGCMALPNDHIYNTDISSLPIHSSSTARMTNIGSTNIDFELSFPLNVMTNTTPTEVMDFFYTTHEDGKRYPILPAPYRGVEANLYPNDYFVQDRHQLGVNIDSCTFTDIYNYYPVGSNVVQSCPLCNAQSGTQYNSTTYDLPYSDGSTDAAGLYVQPLAIRYAELKRGRIDHALRFTLDNAVNYSGFDWPGTNFSTQCGTHATCVPYGSRFRLKSSFNQSTFSPTAQTVLTALKKYGMFMADGGTTFHIQTMSDVASDTTTWNALMSELRNSGTLDSLDFEIVDESSLMISTATGRVKVPNTFNVVPSNYAIVVATKTSDSTTAYVYVAIQPVTVGFKNTPFPPNSAGLSVMAGTPQFQIPYWVRGTTTTGVTCSMSPTVGSITSDCLYTAPTTVTTISTTAVTITPTIDSTGTITFPLVVFSSSGIRIDTGGKAADIDSPAIPYDAANHYGPDANGHKWWNDPVANIPPWYALDDLSSPQSNWPTHTDIGEWYTARHGTSDGAYSAMVPNGDYTLTMRFAWSANPNIFLTSIESQGATVVSSAAFASAIGTTGYSTTSISVPVTVTDKTFYFALRYHDIDSFSILNGWSLELDNLAASTPTLSLQSSGSGINETVTVESSGQFRLVFEADDNWGLSQWYDLVNDSGATTNLTGPLYAVNGPSEPCFAEPGLQNMVFYGDNDKKLFMRQAGCNFSSYAREFTILHNSSSLVVVRSSGSPMDSGGPAITTNTIATVTYYIYPTGKIYVRKTVKTIVARDFGSGPSDLYIAVMGLEDPTQTGTVPPDTQGWIRAGEHENPYVYSETQDDYVFAYWDPTTPSPYTDHTQASIMLVASPNNPTSLFQIIHSWGAGTGHGVTRWGYRMSPGPNMSAGETITYDFLMQLGADNSDTLPNINSSTVAGPIADAFINDPTFPEIPAAAAPAPTKPVRGKGGVRGKGTFR